MTGLEVFAIVFSMLADVNWRDAQPDAPKNQCAISCRKKELNTHGQTVKPLIDGLSATLNMNTSNHDHDNDQILKTNNIAIAKERIQKLNLSNGHK